MISLFRSLIFLVLLSSVAGAQPRHLYLTWEFKETSTTQTIVFQTLNRATDPRVEIYLDKESPPRRFPSKTVSIKGLGRRVHWVTVTSLKPATIYRFRAGDSRYGMSAWKSFRTLPDDDRPLNIIAGGDMYRHPETKQLLQVGRLQEPDVALVGGDIAYADGNTRRLKFWDDWFDNWNTHLNGNRDRLVPMILAIGNHEVSGAFGKSRSDAPFYFGFFPQGGEPYFYRKLGSEIDLIVLDSGHVTSHEAQVPFIHKSLENSKARFRLALYHVPLYPTHRSFHGKYSRLGRRHWVPAFDHHRLHVALENHDHTFKRSHPLKGNKKDPGGTVYLGDGCWGRTPRSVTVKRWYHAKAAAKEHIWLLQNQPDGLLCRAIDRGGEVFDKIVITSNRGERT